MTVPAIAEVNARLRPPVKPHLHLLATGNPGDSALFADSCRHWCRPGCGVRTQPAGVRGAVLHSARHSCPDGEWHEPRTRRVTVLGKNGNLPGATEGDLQFPLEILDPSVGDLNLHPDLVLRNVLTPESQRRRAG